jgi:very-short-patch-repair endonuclease
MRSPLDARRTLEPRGSRSATLHWKPLLRGVASWAACVDVLDALAQSVTCQDPRAAVATLDSALHLGLVTMAQLAEMFRTLPLKYSVLLGLVDSRAESGPETLMRLMLRALGCHVELQVVIPGVGRVDLLVDGWLVIECDSDAHHSGRDAHRNDRSRDLALAALGYTSLRPMAADIMWRREAVLAAVRGLLAARSSGKPPAQIQSRRTVGPVESALSRVPR